MSEIAVFDVEQVRAELPATARVAFLNTGTSGPLPRVSIETAIAQANEELVEGRGNILRKRAQVATCREALASFVGADVEEIALTQNTTTGMNIGVWGLELGGGDEVVTSNAEHEGGLLPLYELHARRGTKVTFVDVGSGEADRAMEAFDKAIRPGVKLVALSHVLWTNGAVLPLREITEMAHERGAFVLVDGAQSVGGIPVDMHALGVDFYAFSGQKWLCGPHGMGGLFVRKDRLEDLRPTYVGYVGLDHARYKVNDVNGLAPVPSAQRYEVGASYGPQVLAFRESVNFLAQYPGRYEAIQALADYCLARVEEMPGVEMMTPRTAERSGLVSFRLPIDLGKCVAFLNENDVEIRFIPDTRAFRISCNFFNTRAEIDRAIDLIAEFRKSN